MGSFPRWSLLVILLNHAACDSTLTSRVADGGPAGAPVVVAATPWPEADALFHTDPHWVGADDAYSVDLGAGRVLWLFADTFVSPTGSGSRAGATMVRNTVGIQTGYDPSSAKMTFHWGTDGAGQPAALFGAPGATWYWPGAGIRVATASGASALILFMMQTESSSGGLGFTTDAWQALYVDNPDADPEAWNVRMLDAPPNGLGAIVGSASVLAVGDRMVAFGPDQSPNHGVYLAAWPLAAASGGDLSNVAFWNGSAWGGTAQIVMDDAQSEFSVHQDPGSHAWIQIQSVGFGGTTIGMRTAASVEGPWAPPVTVYTPPESSRSGVLVYAAKAHPELSGADLVLTYASNDSDFGTLVSDLSLYFPRFVRLTYASPAQGQ